MRELLDEDGENLAVRTFLQLYGGASSVTTDRMREHLAESGFEDCWPDWAEEDMHLTKGGAQNWLRYLFALEGTEQLEQQREYFTIPHGLTPEQIRDFILSKAQPEQPEQPEERAVSAAMAEGNKHGVNSYVAALIVAAYLAAAPQGDKHE